MALGRQPRATFRLPLFRLNALHSSPSFLRWLNGQKSVPLFFVVWDHKGIPQILDLAEDRLDSIKHRCLEGGVMANELIDRCPYENCVLFVAEDFEVSFRCEYGKYARDDTRTG